MLAEALGRLGADSDPALSQWREVLGDLAEVQAVLADRLKRFAGKYVDRILLLAVTDRGRFWEDADGRPNYQPLCDSQRLSELSGLSTINEFPDNEIRGGGCGLHLDGLPLWLMMADRDKRVANQARIVLRVDQITEVHLLPPSDGCDQEVPDVRRFETIGIRFLFTLIGQSLGEVGLSEFSKLYADGLENKDLLDVWRSEVAHGQERCEERLVAATRSFVETTSLPLSSLVKTGIAFIIGAVKEFLTTHCFSEGRFPYGQIWLDCHPIAQSALANATRDAFAVSEIHDVSELGVSPGTIGAVTASLLGLLHVDQTSASVPAIGGASCQRILGRLTPGTPANYRQLLVSMADHCPPTMKLRDAI